MKINTKKTFSLLFASMCILGLAIGNSPNAESKKDGMQRKGQGRWSHSDIKKSPAIHRPLKVKSHKHHHSDMKGHKHPHHHPKMKNHMHHHYGRVRSEVKSGENEVHRLNKRNAVYKHNCKGETCKPNKRRKKVSLNKIAANRKLALNKNVKKAQIIPKNNVKKNPIAKNEKSK